MTKEVSLLVNNKHFLKDLKELSPFKVLLSLYNESTNYWLPIIHSFGFCGEEGHPLSFSYSKKESESNDILIHFVEFSNVHNSDRISNVVQWNLSHENVQISQRKERLSRPSLVVIESN